MIDILASLSPEQLQALSPSQLSALVGHPVRSDRETAAAMTVDEALEKFLLPDLEDAASSHISAIWKAAEYLAQWWQSEESLEHRTASPIVEDGAPITCGDITKERLAAFRFWLLTQTYRGKPLSRRTANKHTKAISSVLQAAFEAGGLQGVTRLSDLDHTNSAPKLTFSDADIDALMAEVGRQDWPSVDPPLWWATAIIGFRTYGFRTEELTSYTSETPSITDVNLSLDVPSPADDGRELWEHGWLSYTPTKQRRRKPQPVVVPLTEAFRLHIDACRETFGSGHDRQERNANGELVPGPLLPMPRTSRDFYEAWRGLSKRAGIDPRLQIKHFRKTMATAWNYLDDGVGELIGGWAARTVVGKHYVNNESRIVRAFRGASFPGSFDRIAAARLRQGMLFEVKPELRSRHARRESDQLLE